MGAATRAPSANGIRGASLFHRASSRAVIRDGGAAGHGFPCRSVEEKLGMVRACWYLLMSSIVGMKRNEMHEAMHLRAYN